MPHKDDNMDVLRWSTYGSWVEEMRATKIKMIAIPLHEFNLSKPMHVAFKTFRKALNHWVKHPWLFLNKLANIQFWPLAQNATVILMTGKLVKDWRHGSYARWLKSCTTFRCINKTMENRPIWRCISFWKRVLFIAILVFYSFLGGKKYIINVCWIYPTRKAHQKLFGNPFSIILTK